MPLTGHARMSSYPHLRNRSVWAWLCLVGFLIGFGGSGASAAPVPGTPISARVDRAEVVIGDEVELTLRVVGGYLRFTPPSFADFEVTSRYRKVTQLLVQPKVRGGSKRRPPPMNRVRVLTLSYRLRPLRVGQATIGSARLQIGKRPPVLSKPITITVKNAPPAHPGDAARSAKPPAGAKIWLHAYPSKGAVVAGEPWVLAWDLYYKPGLAVRPVAVLRAPRLDQVAHGETLLVPAKPEEVTRDGQRWMRLKYSRRWAVADTPMKLVVDPMRLVVRVEGRFPRAVVNAAAYVMPVRALPHGAPSTFRAGQVGRFTMRAQVSDDTGERPEILKAGESVYLDIVVRGSGNLSGLKAPLLRQTAYFEVKQVRAPAKEALVRTSRGIGGDRRFRYVLRPTRPGKIDIPTVVFSFFDPAKNAYVTLREEGDPIRVRTVMDTLYGGLTLGEASRSGFRAEVGWPFLRLTYVLAVSDRAEISPQLRLAYGHNLEAGRIGIEPGFEVRYKLYQRGRFALALYANPAFLFWVPTDGGEGKLGVRIGGPGILASWQMTGKLNVFAGLRIPLTLVMEEKPLVLLPFLLEGGVEGRVFQNEELSVNVHGILSAGPELCVGPCPGSRVKPTLQLTVGASIIW